MTETQPQSSMPHTRGPSRSESLSQLPSLSLQWRWREPKPPTYQKPEIFIIGNFAFLQNPGRFFLTALWFGEEELIRDTCCLALTKRRGEEDPYFLRQSHIRFLGGSGWVGIHYSLFSNLCLLPENTTEYSEGPPLFPAAFPTLPARRVRRLVRVGAKRGRSRFGGKFFCQFLSETSVDWLKPEVHQLNCLMKVLIPPFCTTLYGSSMSRPLICEQGTSTKVI